MKKQNSTLSEKLKKYSALGIPMLAMAGAANAQAIYTDIDPDVTLTTANGEFHSLDLNNDGTAEYTFAAFGGTTYKVIGALPTPYTTGNPNAIGGNFVSFTNIGELYPDNLAQGDIIGSNLAFFNLADIANSANQFLVPVMIGSASSGVYGQWAGGATDHYIPFKFSPDGGANYYYGWARCDVAADVSTITIKDYAYNSIAGDSLFAGQGDPLAVTQVNHQAAFSIFGYDGVATVFVNDANLDGATVMVTNMLGETLMKQPITSRNTQLDLRTFAKGIYLVTVERGEEIFSKKISFR